MLSCACPYISLPHPPLTKKRTWHRIYIEEKRTLSISNPKKFQQFPFPLFNSLLHSLLLTTSTQITLLPFLILAPPLQVNKYCFLRFEAWGNIYIGECAWWNIVFCVFQLVFGIESGNGSVWNLDLVLNCGENHWKMRRRAADFRRPVRRRFSCWIWALLGLFSIAGLVLFVVQHNHHEDRVDQTVLVSMNRTLILFSLKVIALLYVILVFGLDVA